MNEKKRKKLNGSTFGLFATILFIAALALLTFGVVKMMQGEVTVVGSNPEDVKSISVVCKSDSFSYPIFTYDNSDAKFTKVTAIFDNNKIESILLTHSLYYSDNVLISGSEAHNHVALNKSFAANGFESEALNARFSMQENHMQMSLFAKNSDLNYDSLQYFSLPSTPNSPESLKLAYEKQGFICDIDK